MHHVFYAGTTITTGDDLAAALIAVVMRASHSGRAELVELPCRSVDGVVGDGVGISVSLVVQPSSSIVTVRLDETGNELVDERAVARMLAPPDIQLVLSHEPQAASVEPGTTYDFDEWI